AVGGRRRSVDAGRAPLRCEGAVRVARIPPAERARGVHGERRRGQCRHARSVSTAGRVGSERRLAEGTLVLLFGALVAALVWATISGKDAWPFSHYPMFSTPMTV